MKASPLSILSVVLLAATLGLQAQSNPDLEQGMKPYGSYHGGSLDQVSLSNGNLFFQAPLFSYAQRGQLSYPLVLQYNNKNFSVYQAPPTCQHCPANLYVVFGAAPGSPDNGLGAGVTIGFEGVPSGSGSQLNTGLTYFGQPIFISLESVKTPDGSLHPLANSDGGALVTDGSGYRADSVVRDSSGHKYGIAVEDANGNQMTVSSSSFVWTDSLGRQIPPSPGPAYPISTPPPSTAGLGACPALNYAYQPVTYAYTWNLPTTNGGTLPLVVCYASVYVRTNFFNGVNSSHVFELSQGYTMLQSVVFPDNTYWAFKYDAADPNNTASIGFADLLQVTLPTGGTLSYTWGFTSAPGCGNEGGSRGVLTRTVNANDGTVPQPWNYSGGTVRDPAGNETVHTFTSIGSSVGANCSLYETQTQYYQQSHTAGTLLKTVQTDYQFTLNPYDSQAITTGTAQTVANVLPIRVTTTLPNGLVSKVETTYDNALTYHGPLDGITTNTYYCFPNGFCQWQNDYTYPVTNFTGSYGKVLEKREYDWGQGAPGPLLRRTVNTYLWQTNNSYLSNNFMDLVSSTTIYDGASNQVAKTTYGYDEYPLNASGISTQRNPSPVNGSARGNLTSVHHWLNGSTVSTTNCPIAVSNGFLVSFNKYNDTGTVNQSTDSCGAAAGDPNHTTSFTYSSTFAGAFATSVTNPKGHVTSSNYDFNTGLPVSITDPNTQTTTTSYDSLWRPTQVSYPDLGQTKFCYTDTGGDFCTQAPAPFKVVVKKKMSATQDRTSTAIMDGVGRVNETQFNSNPSCSAPGSRVLTTYDSMGRTAKVTNPFCTTGDPTYGETQFAYDALGRATQTTKQDGSISTVSYTGNCVTATDEAGKKRKSCSDALGRLTQVWEDPGGLNYETDYQYDALGNLLRVDQKGTAPGDSSQWRTRLFTYNSLSQLLTAWNPESGTITYAYDANGNMITKADARGIVSTYAYDGLNRVTGKSHSDGTFGAGYTYDQTGVWGPAETNTVGRLVLAYDGHFAGTLFSYDAVGRINKQWDCPPSTFGIGCPTVVPQFNLAGDLTQLTYPNGEIVTFNLDTVGRATSAIDTGSNINFAQSATYGPDGSLTGFLGGQRTGFSGFTNAFTYNQRLQPIRMSATFGSQTVFSINYDFHAGNGTPGSGTDNGNVWAIANNKDTSRNQTFNYDSLNRLISGQNAGTDCSEKAVNNPNQTIYWGNTYDYDAWGNLQHKTVSKCSAENLALTALANNRVSGYSYDFAGNMTNDGLGHNLTFDAESRIAQVNSGAVQYTYDPAMGRVRKDATGQPSTEYYYFGSQVLAEKNISTGNWTNYIFFAGDRIARREYPAGDVFYYFSDHLNTTSAVRDAAGGPRAESDYYPWGGEIKFVDNDSNHYKFTGKERDNETQLDYFGARYYSNGLGRWVSADWSEVPVPVPYADFRNPQSLNLYSYASNVPTTFLDLNGHYDIPGSGACQGQKMCQQKGDDKQGIADWLGSELSNPKSGDTKTSREFGPTGVDQKAVVADTVKTVGDGLQFIGDTAAVIDPSGIVGAGGAFAKGKNGEGILLLGLAFLPGGKKTSEVIHVYQIVKDGKVIYVGITNNLVRRALEHGMKLDKIVTMGSTLDARAVEQALIQHHGLQKNGGSLVNKINSISPRNPKFSDYVKFGFDVLRSVSHIF